MLVERTQNNWNRAAKFPGHDKIHNNQTGDVKFCRIELSSNLKLEYDYLRRFGGNAIPWRHKVPAKSLSRNGVEGLAEWLENVVGIFTVIVSYWHVNKTRD